ncbi:unnamed protein product [Spodoptera exigua]|nr:unnamed protein product [Spodoptera exigua]
MSEEDNDVTIIHVKQEDEVQRKRPKKVQIPHRTLSVTVEKPKIIVMTAGQKPKPVRLNRCLVSPPTLYELAAAVVDKLDYPDPFEWSKFEVAQWIDEDVGFPQYKNGMERGSKIYYYSGNKESICNRLCTIQAEYQPANKEACNTLHLVQIPDWTKLGDPTELYQERCTSLDEDSQSETDEFGPLGFSLIKIFVGIKNRIVPNTCTREYLHGKKMKRKSTLPSNRLRSIAMSIRSANELTYYLMAPRKFRILKNIPDEAQLIWMEHRPGSPSRKEPKKKKEGGIQKTKDGKKSVPKRDSRLMPKRIVLEGLSGKELILARRKKPKAKFLA